MRALVGIALAALGVACATTRTTFDSSHNGGWAERCVRVTDLVHAPLDENGFRFVHVFWPRPSKDTFSLYASMLLEPNDDAGFVFYDGDDKVGGAAQITHYVAMPEVAELFADCLDWSGRFGKKSRIATSSAEGYAKQFAAVYVERLTGRNIAIETMYDTVGLLVSDRVEGDALRTRLRQRMKAHFTVALGGDQLRQ
jgi:hypothetical protein